MIEHLYIDIDKDNTSGASYNELGFGTGLTSVEHCDLMVLHGGSFQARNNRSSQYAFVFSEV